MTIAGTTGTPPAPAGESAAVETPMTFDKMIAEKGEEIVQDGETNDNTDDAEGETDSGDADSNEEPGEVPSGEGEDEESSDGASDDAGGEEEATDAEGEAEAGEGEKGVDDSDLEKIAEKATDGKTVSLKHGDKEYKIPKGAKFTFEKDGKTVDFTLDQIGNQLLTRREIDQRFTKLDSKEKEIERRERSAQKITLEHEDIADKLSLIQEAATSGDIFDIAQATMNIFSDGDEKVTGELFDQLLKLNAQLADMTEDQLRASIKTSQLAFKNRTLTREKQKADQKIERQAQKEWTENFVKSKGVTWEEYVEGYHAVKALDKDRVSKGQPPRIHEKITYEQAANVVMEWTLANRFFNKVANIVGKIDSTQVGDNKLIATVCSLTDDTTSEKDISDIIRGILGKPAAPLKKKVSKASTPSKEVSPPAAKPKAPAGKEAPPKKAPVAQETKKNDDEGEGPVTFDTLKKRYS